MNMEKKKFKIGDYNDQIKDWSLYEELTKKEAIIAKCCECVGYDRKEVKLSPCKSCPLYVFKEMYYNKRKYDEIMEDYQETKKTKEEQITEIKTKVDKLLKQLECLSQ